MPQKFLRKYGVAATLPFTLFETDGIDFKVDAAHVAGDTKIMKDEGVEVNTTNGFTDEGQGYAIVLSVTEMQAKRNVVYMVDQGTKAWLDDYIVIESYGHASAMHPFDLGADLSGNNVDWKFKSIDITNDTGDAFICKSTGGNGNGVRVVGFGAGSGLKAEGGATGHGLEIVSGGTSGNGIEITTTNGHGINIAPNDGHGIFTHVASGNFDGIKSTGYGTGHGLEIVGGATGHGIDIAGGSTSGDGINISAPQGNGVIIASLLHGISVTSGIGTGLQLVGTAGLGADIKGATGGMNVASTSTGHGLNIAGAPGGNGIKVTTGPNEAAIYAKSNGTGSGIYIEGGVTGIGLQIKGGSTSGHGIDVSATDGHGIVSTGGGANEGLAIVAGATGKGITVTTTAGIGIEVTAGGDSRAISASGGVSFSGNGNDALQLVANPGDYSIRCLAGAYFTAGPGQDALKLAGNGAGAGIYSEGGATGIGVDINGGVTSGGGLKIRSTVGNAVDISAVDGIGLDIGASGTAKQAVKIFSSDGHGLEIEGGTGISDGIHIESNSGHGISINAIGGHAIRAEVTGGTTHNGIFAKGFGPGAGLKSEGGSTGAGIEAIGGVGTGNGIKITTIDGVGIGITANGIGKQGVSILSNGGHAISINATGTLMNGIEIDATKYGIESIGASGGARFQGNLGVLMEGTTTFGLTCQGVTKDIDANELDLISLLPEAIMTTIVDTDINVRDALTLAAASVNNKYALNTPSPGQMTIYKRNNVTVLTVVDVTESGRTRIS